MSVRGPRDEPDHLEGLAFEPHLGPGPATPDLTDARSGPQHIDANQVEISVADEPALGWSEVDRSRTPGYRELLRERRAATTPARAAVTVLLAAMAAGPFAVLGALFEGLAGAGQGAYVAVVVVGPVVEEMMKVAALLWLVERRPWLLPGPASIMLVGLAGGLGFAAIENLIYLNVYFPDPDPQLVRWRWTICVLMHGGCSTIAALGLRRMWRTVISTGTPAQTSQAFPFLLTAMITHGAYNALAVMMSMFGLADA